MTFKKLLSTAILFAHIGAASAGLPEALDAIKRRDFDSAAAELKPLADQGVTEAQVLLAQILLGNRENSQNITEAITLLHKAADATHPKATIILASIYSNGEFVKKDEQESVRLLRRLAENKNSLGLVLLAGKYSEGQGVPQSDIISLALLRVASHQDSRGPFIADIENSMKELGPIARSVVVQLAEKMEGVPGLLKTLDAANVDAELFNKKHHDLPSAIKNEILDAEAGDNKAIVKIGTLYLYGNDRVPRDPKRAAYWFQKAASKGDKNAMDYMARLYLAGVGVAKDYGAAFRLFSVLAGEDNRSAAANLGVMYKDGLGTPRDFNKALYWLRKSVSGPSSEYLYPLAQIYTEGLGVKKNLVLGLALARYSSTLNSKSYSLGLPPTDNPATLLVQELKSRLSPRDVAVSSALAAQLLREHLEDNLLTAIDRAERNDWKLFEMTPVEVAAHFIHSYEDENFPLALSLLEPLVRSDDPAAQYWMGYMYENGKGVAEDKKKADSFYELAETQGNVEALTRKGNIYELGKEGAKDIPKAFSTFENAAKRDGAFAQVKVADMWAEGRGVERNAEQAKYWYQKALANQTTYWHSDARNGLAKVYLSEKNFVNAVLNFQLAAATGNKEAQLSLARLYFEGEVIPRSLPLAFALAKVAQADEKYRNQAVQLCEQVKKSVPLTDQATLDSLAVTLSNLDRFSGQNQKSSAEFQRVIKSHELPSNAEQPSGS